MIVEAAKEVIELLLKLKPYLEKGGKYMVLPYIRGFKYKKHCNFYYEDFVLLIKRWEKNLYIALRNHHNPDVNTTYVLDGFAIAKDDLVLGKLFYYKDKKLNFFDGKLNRVKSNIDHKLEDLASLFEEVDTLYMKYKSNQYFYCVDLKFVTTIHQILTRLLGMGLSFAYLKGDTTMFESRGDTPVEFIELAASYFNITENINLIEAELDIPADKRLEIIF